MKNSELLKKAIKKGLKVGYFDIEKSPDLVWVYEHRNTNISYKQMELPGQITSIAYRAEKPKSKIIIEEWDRPKTIADIFTDREKDFKLLKRVIPELNKFDILIGQNINGYDIKEINAKACDLNLPPLLNIVVIDNLSYSRKTFRRSSHKLDARAQHYGVGSKIKQDMDDCIGTAKGDKSISDRRAKYNGRDILINRKVHLKELDYYTLAKKTTDMLKLFIKYDNPTFCIRCAASRKYSRFDVRKARIKNGYRFVCNNCEYQWEASNT